MLCLRDAHWPKLAWGPKPLQSWWWALGHPMGGGVIGPTGQS